MRYHISWKNFIAHSVHLSKMKDFIDETSDICPVKENVFRFLSCDLSTAKYIILGMDPYPSTYDDNGILKPVATGRSFEVANVDKWTDRYRQSSLANIFKALCFYKFHKVYSMEELRELDRLGKIDLINTHKWFDTMEDRGVIFLTATLTTIVGKSGAHTNVWKDFMNELITYINNNSKCMWLIWGSDALDRVKQIVSDDKVIYSCHPASRVKNDFIENNCFLKASLVNWL